MQCKLVNENFHSDYVNNLLKSRGILDTVEFYNPSINDIQEPEGLDNVEEGFQLYTKVVKAKGKMLVVVDSDNDGYTSGACIFDYTKDLDPEADIDYTLHEHKQHGLEDHIDDIMNSDTHYDLIIIPDASSNDYEYHEELKKIHTPVLVLDHHLADGPFSDNAVIVNNQLSKNYKNKELVGAGVTFQFCRYCDKKLGTHYADKYIDLAAWGIIGDMGGMNELENRSFVYNGFNHIHSPLLKAFMEKQGYSITGKVAPSWEELTAAMNPTAVAFYITPLVNAMIRIGSMPEKKRLFEAFIDGDKMIPSGKRGAKGTLDKAGTEAARECGNARSRQNKILDNAIGSIEAKIYKYDLLENRILFVRLDSEDDFPAELNGLVAMKLAAKYKRPTIVARLNKENYDRGSMRGLNQSALTSFRDFLNDSHLFEYVEGHDNAAGISIPNDKLAEFHEYANFALKNIDFGEDVYEVNFERIAADSDLKNLIREIGSEKNIWGQNNPIPYIHVTDINIIRDDITVMGKNKDTVKFEKFGISYLKFHAKELIEQLEKYSEMKVEVVGKANLNEWNGMVTPQIFIEGIEVKEDDICGF